MPRAIPVEVLFDCCSQSLFGDGSDDGVLLLASLEDHDGGNASDTVLGGNVRTLVRVQFQAPELARVLPRELVDYGSNHSAWATPWRPEVHEDRHIALQHQLIERLVRHHSSCTIFQPRYSINTDKTLFNTGITIKHDGRTNEQTSSTPKCTLNLREERQGNSTQSLLCIHSQLADDRISFTQQSQIAVTNGTKNPQSQHVTLHCQLVSDCRATLTSQVPKKRHNSVRKK